MSCYFDMKVTDNKLKKKPGHKSVSECRNSSSGGTLRCRNGFYEIMAID